MRRAPWAGTNPPHGKTNALTVDVEEYFHPTEVQADIESTPWTSLPSRVEGETFRILDLFEAKGVTATFFILGWIAERFPGLVRAIAGRRHQIGCHSYAHRLIYDLTPDEFRRDTNRAIAAIGDACGIMPKVYRAPSYSITTDSLWALEVLVECGFTHDSSIYPISHDRYGIPGSGRHAHILQTPSGPIHELPIATVHLSKDRVAPVGGGGYLRLLPYRYTAAGIRRINNDEQQPACIYFHPWEIDPDQPRLAEGLIARTRTYTGLNGMYRKIDRLLTEFRFSTIAAVYADADSRVIRAGSSAT